MRNLKKLLAVVITVAMLATMMIPAFAAEDVSADAKTCGNLELLVGDGAGVTPEYLAKDTTRMQAAIIMLKLLGKFDEAKDFSYQENFKDANKVWQVGKNVMGYLKANPEYGWVGDNGNFKPLDTTSAQEIYKVILEVLGYKAGEGKDFTWNETITFAASKGLKKVADVDDLTNDDFAAAIVEALKANLKDGDMTLAEKLVADKVIDEKVAQDEGLIATEVKATVAATGAKKLTVTFNQAVDTAKVKFAVKKGSITINVAKVTFADDKKSATLELATKLTEGEYAVTVTELANAVSATVKVENEKVAKIEFASDKAVFDAVYETKVTTSYKVFNQYGEDVTSANTPTFTAGKGTPSVPAAGTLLLTSTSNFVLNEKVAVSAIHAASNTFASTVLTVVPKAQVAEISIDKLYNADGDVPTAGESGSKYDLVVTAKDQYGNDVAYNKIAGDIIVTVSNSTVANVAGGVSAPTFAQKSIDGANKAVLPLAGTLAQGTSTITMISKITGKLARFDVVVKAASTVDVLSLSAPEIAVAGEKVKIPFTAVDQFGAAITKASDLNTGMSSLTSSVDTATEKKISFVQDYVKNVANLELDLTGVSAAQTVFVTGVTKTNKIVTLQVSVVEPAKPVVINNTKDLVTNIAKDATVTLGAGNLVAKDQYGRDIALDFAKYKYAVSGSDDTKVSRSAGIITVADGSITLKGLVKGTSTITVEIQKIDGSAIDNSAITFDVKVVEKADIASYELADLGKTFENTNEGTAGKYEVALKVSGLMADGSKVAVPQSYYDVIINDAKVGYNSVTNTVYSSARTDYGEASSKDIPVIVNVLGANGPVVLTKNITISKEAPAINTIELATSGIATKEADGVVSASATALHIADAVKTLVVDAVKAVDQYGKEISETKADYTYAVATNLPTGRNVDLSNIAAGDTFNVLAITKNGKTITFKVIVK